VAVKLLHHVCDVLEFFALLLEITMIFVGPALVVAWFLCRVWS
jgi:hypothetical protein